MESADCTSDEQELKCEVKSDESEVKDEKEVKEVDDSIEPGKALNLRENRLTSIIDQLRCQNKMKDHLESGNVNEIPCSEAGNMAIMTEGLPESDPTIAHDIDPDLTEVTDIDPDIDSEMLKALGEMENEDTEWGPDALKDIAKRVEAIISVGLKKETKEELAKKYLFPKNIPYLKPPVLNPEISAMLNESSRNRDKRLCSKQEQQGRALTALTKAMSLLLKKNPDIQEVLRVLNDTMKLMTDSHYLETDTRKSLIIGLIDKSLVDSFKDRKRDEFLFGEKLGDLVKTSRGIKKTGQLIQASTSSHLNWKSPSARPRSQKNNQQQTSRAGGYQAQYANRRRVIQPPGPPPARRQPMAPPAPRRQPPAYGAAPYPTRRPQPPPPPPPRAT